MRLAVHQGVGRLRGLLEVGAGRGWFQRFVQRRLDPNERSRIHVRPESIGMRIGGALWGLEMFLGLGIVRERRPGDLQAG
jgi:hypothetical protein